MSKLWKAKFSILCDAIFHWGCRGNLELITLGSERAERRGTAVTARYVQRFFTARHISKPACLPTRAHFMQTKPHLHWSDVRLVFCTWDFICLERFPHSPTYSYITSSRELCNAAFVNSSLCTSRWRRICDRLPIQAQPSTYWTVL